MFALSSVFPLLYQTSDEIRRLAAGLLRAAALCMPLFSYTNSAYFILRSGGKTLVTFLFDAAYTWCVAVLLAFLLTRYTDWPIEQIYFCVMFIDILKVVIGLLMIRSDIWARNVVNDAE